jgi:hypothetical protein
MLPQVFKNTLDALPALSINAVLAVIIIDAVLPDFMVDKSQNSKGVAQV